MPLIWVNNKLQTKRAKLPGTICVSYNGTISNAENQNALSTKREVDIFKLSDDQLKAIQEMFTSSEGDFIISSSARGQSSFGDSTNFGSVDLFTSSLANTVGKDRLTTRKNFESIFNDVRDNIICESDGKQTPISEFNITKVSFSTNMPPSSIPSYQLTLNLQDKNATKNKLAECFDNLIDPKQIESHRIDLEKKMQSIFTASAQVRILSETGASVDREDITTFLGRLSTSRKLLKISPEDFKYDETGKITSLRVFEYSKE